MQKYMLQVNIYLCLLTRPQRTFFFKFLEYFCPNTCKDIELCSPFFSLIQFFSFHFAETFILNNRALEYHVSTKEKYERKIKKKKKKPNDSTIGVGSLHCACIHICLTGCVADSCPKFSKFEEFFVFVLSNLTENFVKKHIEFIRKSTQLRLFHCAGLFLEI